MLRLENLFQFIVPLTFLAIWAITSLFNREAQPPPPRMAGRPPRPPRPDGWNAPGVGQAPRPRPSSEMAPRGYQGGSDDFLVIDESTRGHVSPPRNRSPRGGGRGASPPKAKPRRPTVETTESRRQPRADAISGVVRNIEGSAPVHPLTLKPLELGPALDLKGSLLDSTSAIGSASPRKRVPEFVGVSLTPENLRRNFLMAEILCRPPVGLRGGPLAMFPRTPPTAPEATLSPSVLS